VGVCVLLNYISLLLLQVLSFVYGLWNSKSGYIRRDDKG
jgi:hypothetical protein